MPITRIQKLHGPFAFRCPFPPHPILQTCGVADRIEMVKRSTCADWLGYVLTHCEQKSVRVAAARRLKWVNKAIAGLMAQCRAKGM